MEKELRAKPLIKKLYQELSEDIAKEQLNLCLAIVMLGNDPAAEFYVNSIEKKSKKIGITAELQKFPEGFPQEKLLSIIEDLNRDPGIDGIMVQKPLPDGIDDNLIAASILPEKDVDGFNPVNLGRLMIEIDSLIPSTPAAVIEMIRYYDIELQGKHTVLCGRSHIVGKPLFNLLTNKRDPDGNATLTVCHSRTRNLSDYTKQADILITALGKARLVKQDMIKEGVIIIDVGTNEIVEEGNTSYTGDVDYDDCYSKARAITPVPGGIGSVTTAMLLRNVLKAYRLLHP